jgi:hypothetical protein
VLLVVSSGGEIVGGSGVRQSRLLERRSTLP